MKVTNIIRIIVSVFLIAGIATAITYRKQLNVTTLESWLADAGIMAPLLFMGIYSQKHLIFEKIIFFSGPVHNNLI